MNEEISQRGGVELVPVADPRTAGFRESKHRPWPADAAFVLARVTKGWIDLCCIRNSDHEVVYLATKHE